MKILYEAHASATGGRNGRVTTDGGTLDLRMALPKTLGGAGGLGNNPEQLFACGFALAVRLAVTVPGLPREQAQALIEQAHAVCPYSNAVRGNVEVALELR